MTREEWEAVRFYMEDACSLIAAGKLQRWDVLKWGVTVNLGLAAASVAIRSSNWPIPILSAAVAVFAGLLIYHYNQRMTGARKILRRLNSYVIKNGPININDIAGERYDAEISKGYDKEELLVFSYVLIGSVVLNIMVLALM